MTNVFTFSDKKAVRAAVRIQEGEIVAAAFDDEDKQTESALSFGPVAGVNLDVVFDQIRFVFDVPEIAG